MPLIPNPDGIPLCGPVLGVANTIVPVIIEELFTPAFNVTTPLISVVTTPLPLLPLPPVVLIVTHPLVTVKIVLSKLARPLSDCICAVVPVGNAICPVARVILSFV